MKRFLLAAIVAVAASPALAADVGVSVNIGQPGFYGQINIGNNYPRPQLLYAEPVMIEHYHRAPPPIYLHVPPGHAKHWRKHCHEYNACGRPVYFVQDRWYNDVYAPRYREDHDRRDRGDGYEKHRDDGDRGRERGDENRDDHGEKHGRGHDKGHGEGHGNGHHDD
jgi:opacity protein-like surface antigen